MLICFFMPNVLWVMTMPKMWCKMCLWNYGTEKRQKLPTNREGVSKCTPSFFYAQSPDFHKLGLCYYLKILYL